jgi:molybdopterin-containing oxidoreductase family membrane subunit
LAFLAGSIGLFYFMFLLFVRLMPVLSMFELRKLAHKSGRITMRGEGEPP